MTTTFVSSVVTNDSTASSTAAASASPATVPTGGDEYRDAATMHLLESFQKLNDKMRFRKKNFHATARQGNIFEKRVCSGCRCKVLEFGLVKLSCGGNTPKTMHTLCFDCIEDRLERFTGFCDLRNVRGSDRKMTTLREVLQGTHLEGHIVCCVVCHAPHVVRQCMVSDGFRSRSTRCEYEEVTSIKLSHSRVIFKYENQERGFLEPFREASLGLCGGGRPRCSSEDGITPYTKTDEEELAPHEYFVNEWHHTVRENSGDMGWLYSRRWPAKEAAGATVRPRQASNPSYLAGVVPVLSSVTDVGGEGPTTSGFTSSASVSAVAQEDLEDDPLVWTQEVGFFTLVRRRRLYRTKVLIEPDDLARWRLGAPSTGTASGDPAPQPENASTPGVPADANSTGVLSPRRDNCAGGVGAEGGTTRSARASVVLRPEAAPATADVAAAAPAFLTTAALRSGPSSVADVTVLAAPTPPTGAAVQPLAAVSPLMLIPPTETSAVEGARPAQPLEVPLLAMAPAEVPIASST